MSQVHREKQILRWMSPLYKRNLSRGFFSQKAIISFISIHNNHNSVKMYSIITHFIFLYSTNNLQTAAALAECLALRTAILKAGFQILVP